MRKGIMGFLLLLLIITAIMIAAKFTVEPEQIPNTSLIPKAEQRLEDASLCLF